MDTEEQKIIISGEQIEVKAVPGFSVTAEGIYQGGKEKDATNFVCGFLYVDCILVVGKMRNMAVRGIDIATGKFFEYCFPRAALLGYQDSVTHDLMNAGLAINLQHSKEVRRYLAAYPVTDIVLGYTSTGWAATDDERKMFVLPQRFIGLEKRKAIFEPESPNPRQHAIHAKGSLKEWQANVAAIAKENPILMFAIGAACVAPLLEPLNLNGGGFHFHGGSSKGKTIALQVAASVFGNGTDPGRAGATGMIGRWSATANALEGVAVSFNHLPLLLDELGTSTIKSLDAVIYQITDGAGKEAMNANRELKKARHWRLVILSSGEKSISAEILRTSGREAMTGHLVRFPDISVSGGVLVAYSNVAKSKEVADALKQACGDYYGTAGEQYLEYLVSRINTNAEDFRTDTMRCYTAMKDYLYAHVPNAQSEQMRAVDRFAMVGVALTVLRDAGCVDFPTESIEVCVLGVLNTWLADFPAISEAERAFKLIRSYVLSNPHKFGHYAHDTDDKSTSFTGFVNSSLGCYYFTREQLAQVTGRADVKPIITALHEQGFLIEGETLPSGNKRMMTKVHIRGRQVRMIAIAKHFFDEAADMPDTNDEAPAAKQGEADSMKGDCGAQKPPF